MDDLGLRIARRQEEAMLSAMGMTTNTVSQPTEPLTLDKLKAALDLIPPTPLWLSTTRVSPDAAETLKTKRTTWVVAHPDFWRQVVAKIAANIIDRDMLGSLRLDRIEIRNVDPEESDGERASAEKARLWRRYTDAKKDAEWRAEMLNRLTFSAAHSGAINMTSGS